MSFWQTLKNMLLTKDEQAEIAGEKAARAELSIPGNWQFCYSKHPPRLKPTPGGVCVFDMGGVNEPHYLLRKAPEMRGASYVKISLSLYLPAGASIRAIEGGEPAITFIMQRKGDYLSGIGPYADYRLWAGGYRLAQGAAAGDYFVTIPIARDNFTGVFGQRPSSSNWLGMLSECKSVGLTFGGTFFGHGWRCNGGTARVTLTKFEIS